MKYPSNNRPLRMTKSARRIEEVIHAASSRKTGLAYNLTLKEISERSGVPVRSINRALVRLEELGRLKVHRRNGSENIYESLVPLHGLQTMFGRVSERRGEPMFKRGLVHGDARPYFPPEIVGLSEHFVDALIASGRKQAGYRRDAHSAEWLAAIRRISMWFDPFTLGQEWQASIKRVLTEAAGERWPDIRRPADVEARLQALLQTVGPEPVQKERTPPRQASKSPIAVPQDTAGRVVASGRKRRFTDEEMQAEILRRRAARA